VSSYRVSILINSQEIPYPTINLPKRAKDKGPGGGRAIAHATLFSAYSGDTGDKAMQSHDYRSVGSLINPMLS
jgi:hypothetical protein